VPRVGQREYALLSGKLGVGFVQRSIPAQADEEGDDAGKGQLGRETVQVWFHTCPWFLHAVYLARLGSY
jgi:hypothetical protein